MNMSRADALKLTEQLASDMPTAESEPSLRIGWWTEFIKFTDRLETADKELSEHARSEVARLRGERLSRAIIRLRSPGTAMEVGAQIIEHHRDELKGLLLFLSNSLKRDLIYEDDIVTVNGVHINRSNQSVTYGSTTKTYTEGKLPWQMFQRCGAGENGEAPIVAFGDEAESEVTIKDRLNRGMNRINDVWKEEEGVRLLSIKGSTLKVAPIFAKTDEE